MPDTFELSQYIAVQNALFSSLRLKEVIDISVAELSKITEGASIGVFLADNQSHSFKLLASAGYSQASSSELKCLPFAAASVLSLVKEKLSPISLPLPGAVLAISANIMQREGSQLELGLPLIASDILVGALLFDFKTDPSPLTIDILKSVAQGMAIAIANAILFGRSEYERERYAKFHKCVALLNREPLTPQTVYQAAIDAASFLANTDNAVLLLYDEESDSFSVGASKGIANDGLAPFNLSGTGTIAGSSLKQGKRQYLPEIKESNVGLPRDTNGGLYKAALALPLMYEELQAGVLCLFSSEANAFSDDQIALLESLRREVQPALYQVIKRVVDLNLANDGECELYSRSKFDQIVRRAIDQSGKLSVEAGLLLVGVDVPRFAYDDARQGEINAQVLQIIKDSIRDQDKICNLELVGLGKFAILLPGTAHESILQVAERLNLKVRKSKFGTAAIGEVTVSIGVATFPLHADNAPALFQAGEQALLVARYQGGDRIFEPHTLQVKSSNPDIWEELVERARKAVAIEPMAQEQKQNSLLPDFASWLTKDPVLVESETAEK